MKRLGSKGRSSFTFLAVLLIVSVWLVPTCEGSTKPPDGESIQQRFQRMIDFLDSPDYTEPVSWGEHVVLAYKLAQAVVPSLGDNIRDKRSQQGVYGTEHGKCKGGH